MMRVLSPVWIPKILRLVFSSGRGNSIFLKVSCEFECWIYFSCYNSKYFNISQTFYKFNFKARTWTCQSCQVWSRQGQESRFYWSPWSPECDQNHHLIKLLMLEREPSRNEKTKVHVTPWYQRADKPPCVQQASSCILRWPALFQSQRSFYFT